MMNLRILILSLVLVSTFACQDGTKSSNNPTLPSGFEYVMHTEGNEGKKAEANALAFYRAALRKGDEIIESNYDAPFPQMTMVPENTTDRPLTPIEEAIMMMSEGDSLTIIVPLDTVPANMRPPGFENETQLLYDISLKEVKLKADIDLVRDEVSGQINATLDAYTAGSLENIQETESGLKYIIHEEGKGEMPQAGDYVYVNYYGALTSDKSNFDDSFKRGQPFPFQLGQGRVIKGWDEGIALLKDGSKATFFIPSELGYGAAGAGEAIPPNAELAFYVELIGIISQPTQ